MKKPTLLEEFLDNKPGPPPEPIMWQAVYRPDSYGRIVAIVGPCQTWYEARELARLTFTQATGKTVESHQVNVWPEYLNQAIAQ